MVNIKGNNVVNLENIMSQKNLLITVEHAGNDIPYELNELGLSNVERMRHISYDIGIKGVAHHLSAATGFRCIFSRYSRLLVDLNRPIYSPECIRAQSDGTQIPGNIDLTSREKRERIIKYHKPFHDLVETTIDQTKPKVLISLHSFTPKLNEEKKWRPWDCGILYGSSWSLGQGCIEFLRKFDSLIVGDNEPYKIEKGGDYTVPNHGDGRGIPAVLVEIRQDLIEENNTQSIQAPLEERNVTSELPEVAKEFEKQSILKNLMSQGSLSIIKPSGEDGSNILLNDDKKEDGISRKEDVSMKINHLGTSISITRIPSIVEKTESKVDSAKLNETYSLGEADLEQDQKDLSNLPSYRVINCYIVMCSL
mgnify:CR=1 FL=1